MRTDKVTSGTVHPDRLQLVPRSRAENESVWQHAPERPRVLSVSARHPQKPTETFINPANRCLVATGVGAQIRMSTPDVLRKVTQLLFDAELCREVDNGDTTPIDIHALAGSTTPIHWKIVFKSEVAASVVLERNVLGQGRSITLRAFLDRQQLHDERNRGRGAPTPVSENSDRTQSELANSHTTQKLNPEYITSSTTLVMRW